MDGVCCMRIGRFIVCLFIKKIPAVKGTYSNFIQSSSDLKGIDFDCKTRPKSEYIFKSFNIYTVTQVSMFLCFKTFNTPQTEGIRELETPAVIDAIKHWWQTPLHVSLYILELVVVDDSEQRSELQTHTTRLII